jgi:ubiquinone/menaquinone biosynthesis methyltransferase
VTLRSALSTPVGKQRYVRRLFLTIADRYDLITRVLSYGQDRRWKRRLIDLAQIRPDDRVLDLACGTGDLIHACARTARLAVGLDVTFRMLELGRLRANGADRLSTTRWVQGDMTALPCAASAFSVVTTGYGLRNVPDLAAAIAEIRRVLVPGGRLLSLDFNNPSNAIVRTAYLGYLTVTGSVLGLLLHGDPDTYRYIPESVRTYPGAAGVAELLQRAGFMEVKVVPVLGGLMTIHHARRG